MRSFPGRKPSLILFAIVVIFGLAGVACDSSDDAERLAAQRLFRNYLIAEDPGAEADVRVQGFVDELPPDFPVFEGLTLLGSAFTDTELRRELIVGWESDIAANDIFEFYNEALDESPWSIESDPRVNRIDFIRFVDEDNSAFSGELRIAQEGDDAVVVLIAREFVQSDSTPSGG